MRRSVILFLSLAGVAAAIVALIVLSGALIDQDGSTTIEALPSEDAARIGVQVAPTDGDGLINRDQALAVAAKRWGEREPAIGEPFLQRMTDPDTARSDDPIIDRPVWVVRYAGLSVMSPGGRELHFSYVVIDAKAAYEIHTDWAP